MVNANSVHHAVKQPTNCLNQELIKQSKTLTTLGLYSLNQVSLGTFYKLLSYLLSWATQCDSVYDAEK